MPSEISALSILLAATKREKDRVLDLRRRVYALDEGREESEWNYPGFASESHLLALEYGEPVASVSLEPVTGSNCVIRNLVARDGERRNVAFYLMCIALELALCRGATTLVARVYEEKEKLIDFYRRLGFELSSEFHQKSKRTLRLDADQIVRLRGKRLWSFERYSEHLENLDASAFPIAQYQPVIDKLVR